MSTSSSCQTLNLEPCLLYSQPVINKLCTWGCHAVIQLYQDCKEVAMMHSGKEQGMSHFFSSSFYPMTRWQHHIIQFQGNIFLLANVGLLQRRVLHYIFHTITYLSKIYIYQKSSAPLNIFPFLYFIQHGQAVCLYGSPLAAICMPTILHLNI